MKKIAIFVEGYTERGFVSTLIKAILGSKEIEFEFTHQFLGRVVISGVNPAINVDFFILIADCRNDEQVITQLRDNYQSLVSAGFTAIIGLRDLYPFDILDLPRIILGQNNQIPKGTVPVSVHIAIMEIEAWFIAEIDHFANIHPSLTVPFIVSNGIDIVANSPSSWTHPAETLDSIYKSANARYLSRIKRRYVKKKRRIDRTIKSLSYDNLYLICRTQLNDLDHFVTNIEAALFSILH